MGGRWAESEGRKSKGQLELSLFSQLRSGPISPKTQIITPSILTVYSFTRPAELWIR